jgi:uncharacterized protein
MEPAANPQDASIPKRPTALLGMGSVRHARLRPAEHRFSYPTWFLFLPMRSLRQDACPALRRNRAGWISFADRDHGNGGPDALAWAEALLEREGVDGVDGEIWLQTYPRVAGFAFKPVSFWYCHRADGSLRAVLAEVNNTFGERHCYVLDGPDVAFGATLSAEKVFHVSPFCQVRGTYRFRFGRAASRAVARVEVSDAEGPLLNTSLSGELQPLTRESLRRANRSLPLLAWTVMARIHWQALALWRKQVPYFSKPQAPTRWVSR